MPTINVIPSWNVKKLNDSQVMSGTIYANGVYKFSFNRNNESHEQVMSIKDIIPVIDEETSTPTDYKLIPSIIFFDDGFIADDQLEESDTLIMSELTAVEREFVKYEAFDRSQRRNSIDEDPFVFNFINSKTSKPFQICVDHDHFVGIPALTKKGNVHTNFGYIDHVVTDEKSGLVTKIIMNSIISTRGVFRSSTTTIPYDKIRGIYHYNVVVEPHKNNIIGDQKPEVESATEETTE